MLDTLMERINNKVDGQDAFGYTVKLDLGETGKILIDGNVSPIGVSESDGPADTTFVMSADDLSAMLAGELPPMNAYMQGKLRVEGDMGKAMQFGSVFS